MSDIQLLVNHLKSIFLKRI